MDEANDRIQVLLQHYAVVSEEITLYLKEVIKCFVFLAAYLAVGLGLWEALGAGGEQLHKYWPYGLLILGVYFLVLSTIKLSLTAYRGHLESEINRLAGRKLMFLESEYRGRVFGGGWLRLGSSWWQRVPTPMHLFAWLLLGGIVLLRPEFEDVSRELLVVLTILAVGSVYVLVVYPSLAEQALLVSSEDRTAAPTTPAD